MSGLGRCGAGREELRYKPAALAPEPGFQQHTQVPVPVFLQPPLPPGRGEIPFIFSGPQKKPGRQATSLPGCAGGQETGLSEHPQDHETTLWTSSPARPAADSPARFPRKSSRGWTARRVPWSSQQDGAEPTVPTGLSPTSAPRLQPGASAPAGRASASHRFFRKAEVFLALP